MATKRLALELGLVQKRKLKGGRSVTCKATQEFDYLVVLDFESTCWETGPRMSRQEIIEFPAVLLHLTTGNIVSEFQQYVMPVEQPILSEFCTNLTGITQDQVEAGMPLGTCIGLFSSWIRELCDQYQISFNTSVPGKHATFATWSDWDLGVCLHYECNRKQLKKPEFFNQWIDIKVTYKNFYQRRPQGLAGALKDVGISFEGREHSGICDTRNTAVLISRMARDGCVLKITKAISAKPKVSTVKEAAQKLFNQVKNVVLGKRTSEDNQEENIAKKRLAKSSTGPSTVSSSVHKDLERKQLGQKLEHVNFNLGLSGIVYDSSAAVRNGANKKAEASNRIKSCVPNKISVQNVRQVESVAHSSSTSPKLLSYTRTDPFKTPLLPSARCGPRVSVGLSKSSIKKTPITCRSNVSSLSAGTNKSFHTYKKTPPFCGCGRRAKLLLTCKPGPNEGRYFFSCPSGGTINRRSCKYFKWEDKPFVKAPIMNPYCTPLANLNSNFSAKSLPVRRAVKDGVVGREAVSEPACNQKIRCIGLSRSSSSFSLSQQKAPVRVPSSDCIKTTTTTPKVNVSSTNGPYEITPFIIRQESKLKRNV